MGDVEKIVIVGGGIAAGRATTALRRHGWDGSLIVVTEERYAPYERPPLSKDLLLHPVSEPSSAFVASEDWYAENDVDLRTETRATRLDLAASVVEVEKEVIPYDRLLIATGARPRPLPPGVLHGPSGAALIYLRTIDQSVSIRERLAPGAQVVMIGGGWIAMEVAAAARLAGCDVTVLERGRLPLLGSLGWPVAHRFTDLHRSHGVDVRVNTSVSSVEAGDDQAVVELVGGERLVADLVVVGIGARPNTELAAAAGLAVSDGIDADRFLRTASSEVFVAGDVANPFHPGYGRHLRLEHWDNGLHQGELAAANLISAPAEYARTPYFFTDQFELGMEMCGHLDRGLVYETVVRGDISSDSFAVFWLSDDRVAAGLHVNEWDAMGDIRTLVEARALVDSDRLADSGVGLDHQAV
ncbi:FAD-dependent oxidoreductase [Nocardioides sp. CN2-186]|uniref:NAD(P)/FAD-dependent oxidoreductase n=1 Tax=Nocardioides tweenelious TaxID=3156607 RepID=UPI0032B51BDA